ncbi:MAG: tetratricopeptide repeat protein [Planctomycetes bacterium]|nr:tetratricopeptide repeat protein [Planctomycetota bacterium]
MRLTRLVPFAALLLAGFAPFAPAADVERALAKGRDALQAGRVDEAAAHFEAALKEEPKEARGWILLARARCLAAQQQLAAGEEGEQQAQATIVRAEEAARSAVELDPHGSDAWATLGHVLVVSGSFSEAIDTLYHAEKLGAPTPELMIDLSDALLMAREFALETEDNGVASARLADAEAALERASGLGDGQVAVFRRRAEIHAAKGEPRQAARAYRRALVLRPADATLHEAHLKMVEQTREFDEARDFVTGLVDEPAISRWYRSRLHELAGHVAFNKTKDYVAAASAYLSAEADFKDAAKHDPALAPAVQAYLPTLRAFRGRALTLAQKFPEAEAAVFGALDLDPAHADAHDCLQALQDAMWQKFGGESMKAEQWEEIRAFASKRAMVEPEKADNWNNWGFFARECKKYEESFQAYRRALALEPENARFLNDAALILMYHLGRDLDRAEEWLVRSIELAEKGWHDEARTSSQRADDQLTLGDAYGNLINMYSQDGRETQAIARLRELEQKLPKRSEVSHWKQKLLPDEWTAEQEKAAAEKAAREKAKADGAKPAEGDAADEEEGGGDASDDAESDEE